MPRGPAECGNGVVEEGEECDGVRFAPVAGDSDLLSCELNAVFHTGVELCKECHVDRTLCPGFSPSRCGNGVADSGETCDGNDLRGLTCADLGGTGDLRCDPFLCILDRTGCINVGGNGRREGSEVCDGAFLAVPPTNDVGEASCQSLGYGDGTLTCRPQPRILRTSRPFAFLDPVQIPRFSTFECSRRGICGDGRATDFEECDGDDFAGASCATFDAEGDLHCTDSCAFDLTDCRSTARCGDGRISFGEECEPGRDLRLSCTEDGGVGSYTCDPQFCSIDQTGCVFTCGVGAANSKARLTSP